MSFETDQPDHPERMMEWATKLDELLLDFPVSEDAIKSMGANTRTKLILLGKFAEQVESQR